ncbi:MAG: hypothetical protein BWY21_01974 [Parcubacteria group bacterium ADurb.Bin216]|jgi:hypothetical protein|nr:MAG: hypothetical protein BWY21_01974 [Parcubacteria group bacterium ADurb.Bin216]
MNSPLSDYIVKQPEEQETEEVGVAIPKVSEYREKFKSRKLTIDDLRPGRRSNPIDKEPSYGDEAALLGPGIEEDWL